MSTGIEQQAFQGENHGHASTQAFEVHLPGPLDIPASLELFRSNGDDLMDRWDGATLIRTLPVGTQHVAYACTVRGTREEPSLQVVLEDTRWKTQVEQAILTMFVHPPASFVRLLQTDLVIAQLEKNYPGLRPVLQFDLFAALVRSISAQQVNLRWATTTRRRLAEVFGEKHLVNGQPVYSLHANRLAAVSPADIRALQFTTRKAEYIIGVAQEIANGDLSLADLTQLSNEEVTERLTSLRGIGRWTAEWLLARTFGRPCVVAGDLAIRKAVGWAYPGTSLPSEHEVRERTSHWGSSAGIAQVLLLRGWSHTASLPGAQ
jgi:DNA-3-methyladenine glycosylase II